MNYAKKVTYSVVLIGAIATAHATNTSWVNKLTANQQAEYNALKKEFPKEFAAYEDAVAQINSGKLGDPEGADGERMLNVFLDLDRKMKSAANRQLKLSADSLKRAIATEVETCRKALEEQYAIILDLICSDGRRRG